MIDFIQNSVNARYQTIPYPWLVFGEKVKVNTVFIRDSTGVSDSILILFGGNLNHGAMVNFFICKSSVLCNDLWLVFLIFGFTFFQDGHLTMLEGYVDFFMDPSLAECYVKLKEELDTLLQKKVFLILPDALFILFLYFTCMVTWWCYSLIFSFANAILIFF